MTPTISDITSALKWLRMPYKKQMHSVGNDAVVHSHCDATAKKAIKDAREFYRLLKAAEECEL